MLNYPLELGFKIATIGTRVRVVDAAGRQVAYVRKKKFRLREEVTVYEDESQKSLLYRIKADRVWDFGASYHVSTPDGRPVGAVRQHGMKSLWKSSYAVSDDRGEEVGLIHEEKPWVKVLDGLAESLPGGDALGGLFFNPSYLVELRGRTVLRMTKERSLFESKFKIEKLDDFSEEDEDAVLASLIMMVLLERDRG
jgi:uncharacterized protein YxjI